MFFDVEDAFVFLIPKLHGEGGGYENGDGKRKLMEI